MLMTRAKSFSGYERDWEDIPLTKIPEHHQSTGSGFSDGDATADEERVLSDDDRAK
ncbi:unnamed protein product [Plutella xylostella]|uniref:(diamondback moth) hypothetical protein n=1 Tax=Plutella xylostella TaxID=51655 RepID=A0A8S4G5A6_PLUXY|nr:unnamed protein product [Plutella xylostella]